MSLYARLIALAILLIAAAGVWWKFERVIDRAEERGYMRRAAEDKAAAEAQTERNRELQRATEKKYVVQAEAREEFIAVTVREIHEAAAPLADCRVPDAVRLRLDAAARCALGDSAAACGADGQLPGAPAAAGKRDRP
jgi:hypothetical protein